LISFLEGTRLTESKLQDSRDFCKSRGYPLFSHLLFPRTKGFVATVKGLRGQVDAIYDITLVWDGDTRDDFALFKRLANRQGMDVYWYLRRYEMKDIPQDDEGIRQWCIDRWKEKEKLIEVKEK